MAKVWDGAGDGGGEGYVVCPAGDYSDTCGGSGQTFTLRNVLHNSMQE